MAGETKILTVGQAASALDIFLSANGAAVSGQYVGFQLFDAANVSAVSGVALNPALGQYTGSGLIPAGYQLGSWHIDWTIVTETNSVVRASEPFQVQDLTVSIGFVPPTDKTATIYDAVRIDIGDPEGHIFDDNFLQHVLIKAVRRLNQALGLSRTSRPIGIPGGFGGPKIQVAELTVDVEAGTISPNNDELCDLIILQMEFIIITSETSALKRLGAAFASGPFATVAGGIGSEGISVTNADGVTINISTGRLQFRSTLQRLDVETREKELETAIKRFLSRMTGNMGKMIY
jgi:hypothetical protein